MGLAYVAPIGLQNLFVINAALQNKEESFFTAAAVIFSMSPWLWPVFSVLAR